MNKISKDLIGVEKLHSTKPYKIISKLHPRKLIISSKPITYPRSQCRLVRPQVQICEEIHNGILKVKIG